MWRDHILMYPESTYSFYNHAIGSEVLFKSDHDYNRFLIRLKRFIHPIAYIDAWSLLPDQFEIIIKIKDTEQLLIHYEAMKGKPCLEEAILSDFIMERFSNWLNSYTKTFNNNYNRKGALFTNYSGRQFIISESEHLQRISRLHLKSEVEGYLENFEAWPFTSYKNYITSYKLTTRQMNIVEQFGGIEKFRQYHKSSAYEFSRKAI